MPGPLRSLTLPELQRRTSQKWRHHPPDVLPLWVAEMDAPLAEPVAAALLEAVALGDTGYPTQDAYGRALAEFAWERWGWQVEAGLTSLVPDVMLGLVEVLQLVNAPGDAVVVNPPVYPPFFAFVEHARRQVLEVPLTPAHRLDLPALERVFDERRPAAYLLCSPHNPTGTVHTAGELAAVAALAQAYGVRVVVDEVHAPLVLPGAVHVPYLSVSPTGIALLSASKAWHLAGLKAAVAVAGPEAADDLARLPEVVWHGASHLGVLAHTAALRDGRAWLDALLLDLDGNRRLVGDLLAEHLPSVRWRQTEGTYLGWLDCRALRLPADPAAVFLEHGRVALVPGPDFGTGGAGHARLNLATTPQVLGEAVRRMAAAVRRVGGRP